MTERASATKLQGDDNAGALLAGAKVKNALARLDGALKARDASGVASALDAVRRALESARAGYAKGGPGGEVADVAAMLRIVQQLRSAARNSEWMTVSRLVNSLRGKLDMSEVSRFAYAHGGALSPGALELVRAAAAMQVELDEIEQRKDDWAAKQRASWGRHPEMDDGVGRGLIEQRVDREKDAVTCRWMSSGTPSVLERNSLLDRARAVGLSGLVELRDLAGSIGAMESKLAELEQEQEHRSALEEVKGVVNDRWLPASTKWG